MAANGVPMTDLVLPISAALTIAGIIFQAGRLSSRVDALEKWRAEIHEDVKTIRALVENLSGAVSARKI